MNHVDPSKSSSTSPPLVNVLNRLSAMGSLVTTKRDGSAMAQCPCHEDKKQSLSITANAKGDVLLHDHAGCETPTIVSKMGMTMAELFVDGDERPSVFIGGPKGTVVAVYPYTDEKGALQYEAVRMEPKGFRQRRPDGKGGHIWNMQGATYYLYRLAELLKKKRTTIFLVEGEKDADTLWSHKLPATTNVGGAGKWRPEYTQQLVAAKVTQAVIFPDHDEPGRKHALKVATELHGAGLTVKVVHLPVVEKGDVSDYLAVHSKDELFGLVKGTAVWAPRPTPEATTTSPAGEPARDFGGIISTNMGDVVAEDVCWHWPGRVPVGMLVIFAGPPGVGKSFVSLDVGSRTTTGAIWPDVGSPAPQGTVVLLAAEDSAKHTIKPRLVALGADCYKVEKVDAIQLPDRKGRATFSLSRDLGPLEQMIVATGAKLVIVDPVNSYLGGRIDGFKDTEVRAVLDPLKELAERLGVAVILIMHVKKGTEEEVIYRIGGSVGFPAVARAIFFCTEDPEQPGRVYFSNPKMNIAPKAKSLAYRIGADSRLEWDRDEVKLTAHEILNAAKAKPGPKPQKQDEARRWLVEYLKDGARPAAEGERAAIEAEISEGTLKRALKAMDVAQPERDPETGKVTRWVWRLPMASDRPF